MPKTSTKVRIPGSNKAPPNENQSDNAEPGPNATAIALPETTDPLILDQLNEMRATLNDIVKGQTDLSQMVGDHEARLLLLGADAKPIPRSIFGGLDQSIIFGAVTSQVISGFLQTFPHSKNDPNSIRDYSKSAIMAAVIVLEELNKRAEDSHK